MVASSVRLSAKAARGRAASCTDTFGMGECMQLLP